VKKPQLLVDAFAPALARLVGACDRARAEAVFAAPPPPLATRSPDLVLDDTDGDAAPDAGNPATDGATRTTRT
jgi:hypothetical protein